ncbi:MAG: hypothetical protein J6I49_04225 [Bacteroidales bacterium]|nr:hypothetical protein [Bacteroidales bacterium]
MKPLYKYLIVFAALICAYLLFGAGAYLMPDGAVQHHVRKTLEHGDLDSDQPRAILPNQLQTRMDNFTDAIILNQAYVMRCESFCSGLLSVPRWWGPMLPFEVLRAGVDGQELEVWHYARYWHGNTFLSRYLLALFDYISIRMLLYILTSLLMLWCGVVLWRRGGWPLAAPMLFALWVCYAFVMQFSMQFVMVLALALAGMIAVGRQKEGGASLMPFFVIGSLTCYFDLLTAPVLTLGMMLVLQAALSQEARPSKGWLRTFYSALLWAAGYAATWVSKWVIATLFTSENILVDGWKNTLHRSGIDDFSRWDALAANLELLPWKFVLSAIIILAVLAVLRFNARGWRRALMLLPVAFLPWVWYLLAADHSYWHNWFTFRAQAVSVAAVLLALAQMVDWRKLSVKHHEDNGIM